MEKRFQTTNNSSLSTYPLREEKSFSQRAFSIYTGIRKKVYLTTPVRKAGYIDKTQVTENMVFAGETAFSAAQCDTRIKAVAINQNTGKTDVF